MATSKRIDLECSYCGTHTPMREFQGACPNCGEVILEARYDMDQINAREWISTIANRRNYLWRYHEVLPIYDTSNIISLGEGSSPLIKSEALAASLGLKHLYIKDERQGPTGSFKDRQATVAISWLKERGINEVVVASTGNVAIAYAAYAARVGIKLWAFFPALTPNDKMRETAIYGAEVIKTTGTYDQTKALAAQFASAKGIFLDKGIKSVAAIEAMKTMSYEVAEQLTREMGPGANGAPWRSPDWFFQGVSGGMGPIGVGKGFREMLDLGLVDKMPQFGIIQSSGCAPMVEAYRRGQRVATPVEDPRTFIVTLATGNPGRAYEMLYDYVHHYGGHFTDVSDEDAFNAIRLLARMDGISVEPATGVTFAGLIRMVREGVIQPDDVVVMNGSGHTLPVEKTILGEQWQEQVDMSAASATPTLPKDRIIQAVDQVNNRARRIAVIEDNEEAARLISRLLQSSDGVEVRMAHNGASGWELVKKWQPDMVITDLMMPDVDGFELISKMKSDPHLMTTPIVVVTAKELTVREREYLDREAEMLLQKGSFVDDEFVESLIERLKR